MDRQLLENKIRESGLKKQDISKRMNMCHISFINRLNGNKEFRPNEITSISEILKLTQEDIEKIF